MTATHGHGARHTGALKATATATATMAMAMAMAMTATMAMAGCGGGDDCGPGAAPADGLVVDVPAVTGADAASITYGGFTSSANNDCTPPGQELTSLTLDGIQTDPAPARDFALAFCLPRPDRLGGPVSLADTDLIQLIDLNAEVGADGCVLTLDRATPPQGTVDFTGYCGDGSDPAGYAIRLDAVVPGLVECPDSLAEAVTLEVSGEVAVEALLF